jgi:hypothetical protein
MNAQEKEIGEAGSFELLVWCILAIACAIHVYRNCRRIGEPPFFNVTGTLMLFPIYYIGWILWWPGTLRHWMAGGSIDDLATARAYQPTKTKRQVGDSE